MEILLLTAKTRQKLLRVPTGFLTLSPRSRFVRRIPPSHKRKKKKKITQLHADSVSQAEALSFFIADPNRAAARKSADEFLRFHVGPDYRDKLELFTCDISKLPAYLMPEFCFSKKLALLLYEDSVTGSTVLDMIIQSAD